jgi:hypothetical protein
MPFHAKIRNFADILAKFLEISFLANEMNENQIPEKSGLLQKVFDVIRSRRYVTDICEKDIWVRFGRL